MGGEKEKTDLDKILNILTLFIRYLGFNIIIHVDQVSNLLICGGARFRVDIDAWMTELPAYV